MSIENFIFGRKKWATLLPLAVEQHKKEPQDVDPNAPAVQELTALFNSHGVTAQQLTGAVIDAALKDEAVLPEAAAQRPDIDTITPVLT